MRNLKRALSLALASVMLVGMMVVGTSAVSFPDVDESKHDIEAIEVLKAVGVMNGDAGTGKLRPDDKVSRNEMAVIMARLILGTYAAESYVGTHPFTDVPSWADRYVAACYNSKIINGTSATTYSGTSNVTAVQAAAMMLRALGYEDLSKPGQKWDVSVAAKANEINLFEGLTGSGNAQLTRNEIASLSLNTLKADVVTTERTGFDMEIPGVGTINSNVNYNRVERNNEGSANYAGSASTDDGYGYQQLCEKLYGKDLKLKGDTDDFGRPASTWAYKNDDVITTADDADESMVLNKELDYSEAMVTDDDYFDYDAEDVPSSAKVYVNGDLRTTHTTDFFKAGDLVEVYEDGDGKVKTVAVTRYSLAVIDEIETNLSSTHTNRGASCSITLEDLNESGIGVTYYDAYDTSVQKVLTGFNSSTYTEGTVLAIALADDNDILASHVAETVEGAITAVNTGSKATVTLDGTQYPIHSEFDQDGTAGSRASLSTLNLKADSYAVYLDANGYVIGIGEAQAAKISDVYYVTGILKDTSRYTNYYAQAISLEDGTVKEFLLKQDDTNTNKAFYGSAATSSTITGKTFTDGFESINGLFTFEKDGSKYTAKRYVTSKGSDAWKDSDSTYTVKAGTNEALLYMTDDLAKDATRMTLSTANNSVTSPSRFYVNSETNYIKVEKSGADLDVQMVTGGTSVKWDTDGNSQADVQAIAITRKDGSSDVASYVILVSNDFKLATSDNVVFVSGVSDDRITYKDKNGDTKYGYDTELYFMDGSGKIDTVPVEGSAKDPGFYTWEINDDDVYELTSTTQKLTSGEYEDETGYIGFALNAGEFDVAKAVGLTSVYNNKLTVDTATDSCKTLDDVAFADDVIIRDDRGTSARNADKYTGEITSVSALDSAIKRCTANTVKGIVYLDDEKVVMVYVLAVEDAPAGPGPGPGPDEGEDGTLPEGIVSVDVTTNKAEVTLVFDTSKFTGKPSDAVVANALIAELSKVENGGWSVDKTAVVISSDKIEVPVSKVEDGFTATDKYTFKKLDASYQVTYKVGGSAKTKAWNTLVGGTDAANTSETAGKSYVKILGTTPSYVLSNTTVKTGVDYEASNAYYKVTIAATVATGATNAGTSTYAMAFTDGATEKYITATGNVHVKITHTTGESGDVFAKITDENATGANKSTFTSSPSLGTAAKIWDNSTNKFQHTAANDLDDITLTWSAFAVADNAITLTISNS